jgi:hypothetical protein
VASSDRVADPWEERTFYGRAEAWPVRVDVLSVVDVNEQETAVQLKWLRTRMKQAAPQALVVA